MTHDPLCSCESHKQPHIQHLNGVCHYCQCDLIVKVRADQRDKAVQRVEQNVLVGMTLTPKEVCAVIAAVRGES